MSWAQDYWDALAEAEQAGVPAPTPRVYAVPVGERRLPFDKRSEWQKQRARLALDDEDER